MECKFCNNDKTLVKAHVIPEAFFRESRTDSGIPKLISNISGEFPKKAPIGIYDVENVKINLKFGIIMV